MELVAERGLGNVSHRAIAQRAGVPLGSTTYYFPNLDELIAAGLRQASADAQADIAGWRPALENAAKRGLGELAATLAELVAGYVARRDQALIEYELYLAAGRDERLQSYARSWFGALLEILEDVVDATVARQLSAQIDGVSVQALVFDEPVDVLSLRAALARLLS